MPRGDALTLKPRNQPFHDHKKDGRTNIKRRRKCALDIFIASIGRAGELCTNKRFLFEVGIDELSGGTLLPFLC